MHECETSWNGLVFYLFPVYQAADISTDSSFSCLKPIYCILFNSSDDFFSGPNAHSDDFFYRLHPASANSTADGCTKRTIIPSFASGKILSGICGDSDSSTPNGFDNDWSDFPRHFIQFLIAKRLRQAGLVEDGGRGGLRGAAVAHAEVLSRSRQSLTGLHPEFLRGSRLRGGGASGGGKD